MSLRLIIEDDEGTTTVVPLGADAITIGRQQGNTIQLTEKNVSRRHARLFPEQEAWCIEDLGSYNGVKVNGSAVDARLTLKEGDVVQIGDYHLALTDNVDKSTLNFSPGQGAANDNGASGQAPVVASSSNDLPRLSTEDLAALQSGPQPVAAAPSMLDSGAMPAAVGSAGFEEEKKSNTGLLIGFGAVVVGALVLGFAWMARTGNDDPPATQVASAGKVGESKRPPTPEGKTMAGVADSGPAAVVPPTEPVADPTANPTADPTADSSGEPTDPPPTEPVPVAEPAVEEPVEIADDPPTKPRRDSRPKKSKPKPPSHKPTPPAAPAVDTKALLADARKASLLKHRECYDLAKQAYSANRSTAASELMAKCACGMGDAAKAKKAASRLRGDKKEQAAKLCEKKGITL